MSPPMEQLVCVENKASRELGDTHPTCPGNRRTLVGFLLCDTLPCDLIPRIKRSAVRVLRVMGAERRVLEIKGATIRTGTSLFDTETGNVLWYEHVQDGTVQLETVDDPLEMSEGVFRVHINTERILIESQPPGHADASRP